jgi:hypothetical protein
MGEEKPIEIRDQRSRQKYYIDDAYLNGGYARLCGVAATAVYNSLSRHADARQECYPSIQKIAEQHGITSRTVIRSIKKLEEWNIVSVTRKKNPKTKRQMSNVYILVHESSWKPIRVTPGQPAPSDTRATGPGDKNDKKPGDTRAMEGFPEEKDSQREGSAAQSAPAILCAENGCKEEPMKGKGVDRCPTHQPMSCEQFITWYRQSPSRHIKIIAEFLDELRLSGRNPDFRTVAQWQKWADGRMKKWAMELSVFDDDQIGKAIKRMMAADYVTDFNLNTVKTFLFNAKK